jgi:hypothetical protein
MKGKEKRRKKPIEAMNDKERLKIKCYIESPLIYCPLRLFLEYNSLAGIPLLSEAFNFSGKNPDVID